MVATKQPVVTEGPPCQVAAVEHRCGHIRMVLVWKDEERAKHQKASIMRNADCPDCSGAKMLERLGKLNDGS